MTQDTATTAERYGAWPKVIRDPVHDIIPFQNTACDNLLLNLINTREFQRLRRIKQLGMSELVFPGANHSRFAHSIGVMHNARRFLNRLLDVTGESVLEEQRTAVLAAALLHDLGHGPFSHTFEKITGEDHEDRTRQILLDDGTEVNACLRQYDEQMPERLTLFFDKDPDEAESDGGMPPFLTHVVSSQLDADRFDYLLRDSHATGTDYGHFDAGWLIEHLHTDGRQLHLSHKGFMAAEAYVFARMRMYRTVYYHKTTRAAEVMLRSVLKRYQHLLSDALDEAARGNVVPNAPVRVARAFSPREDRSSLSLGDYLDLDDYAITEFLKCCEDAGDATIRDIGSGLAHRKLFKAVEASDADKVSIAKFYAEAREAVSKQDLDHEYWLVDDAPADTPYKPYSPDPESASATQIFVQDTLGQIQEISRMSRAVEAITAKYQLLRYYFPESIRQTMLEIAKRTLSGL